jgi:hypothetical protein
LIFFLFVLHSGSSVPGMGRSIVYCGTKSSVRVQRKPLHIDGNLQRISSYVLSQRFNVSFFRFLSFCLHFFPIFSDVGVGGGDDVMVLALLSPQRRDFH